MDNDPYSFGNFTNGRPNLPRPPANPDTTAAPIVLGVGGSLLFVSVGLMIARLWSRLRTNMRLHWDDWTVLAATALAIVNYIILAFSVVYGLGRHARFVSFARRRTSLRLIFIDQVIWYWSLTLVKCSVALLLLRIKGSSKHSSRYWKIFLYSMITLLIITALVGTVFQFTQCRPFAVYWDPRYFFRPGGVKCFRPSVINGYIILFSTMQITSDLIFSFVPIAFIRKLNRPTREKVFMAILMGLGLFASAAALMRTLQLQAFYSSKDLFRTNVNITLWATVEQQFGLMAATIPTLKAFFEKILIKIGQFFYDEGTETQVRGRLVKFGLLGEDEEKPISSASGASGSLGSEGIKETEKRSKAGDNDSIIGTKGDKEVEDMLRKNLGYV